MKTEEVGKLLKLLVPTAVKKILCLSSLGAIDRYFAEIVLEIKIQDRNKDKISQVASCIV
ncbi:MAG: hypothetical protein A2687_04670 [Candidatus Levybacteria bacterium RIFCSPHIGHO2_01_FULL_38_26]|nr:MAG: hypothetical protein A2687_04670 [Candidatus Levybacteria bacterium RIFCSPHIGHO2_01_FULL_38_26]